MSSAFRKRERREGRKRKRARRKQRREKEDRRKKGKRIVNKLECMYIFLASVRGIVITRVMR